MRCTAPPFIPDNSFHFFRVGLCSRLMLNVQVTWLFVVRRIRSQASIVWTRSPLNQQSSTCAYRDLSERDRWRLKRHVASSNFNRAMVRSWGDRWTHLDTTMEIERRDWWDCEIMVSDHRTIMAHDHRVIVIINRPSPDQMTWIFRAKSPYKMTFFPL